MILTLGKVQRKQKKDSLTRKGLDSGPLYLYIYLLDSFYPIHCSFLSFSKILHRSFKSVPILFLLNSFVAIMTVAACNRDTLFCCQELAVVPLKKWVLCMHSLSLVISWCNPRVTSENGCDLVGTADHRPYYVPLVGRWRGCNYQPYKRGMKQFKLV